MSEKGRPAPRTSESLAPRLIRLESSDSADFEVDSQ